jgi:hypothetical protein
MKLMYGHLLLQLCAWLQKSQLQMVLLFSKLPKDRATSQPAHLTGYMAATEAMRNQIGILKATSAQNVCGVADHGLSSATSHQTQLTAFIHHTTIYSCTTHQMERMQQASVSILQPGNTQQTTQSHE